jgi:hypothetical protein
VVTLGERTGITYEGTLEEHMRDEGNLGEYLKYEGNMGERVRDEPTLGGGGDFVRIG